MSAIVAELFARGCFSEMGGVESCMKVPFAVVSILILSLSAAQAAQSDVPLAGGKPAGLHQAQLEGGNGMFLVAGAALVGITVALATAGDSPGVAAQPPGSTSTSTATTSP